MRNTAALSHDKRGSYDVELRAEDCGGRLSDVAVLTVHVKPLCQPGWTGEYKLTPELELLVSVSRKLEQEL